MQNYQTPEGKPRRRREAQTNALTSPDEKNQENRNLRFARIFWLLCVNISPAGSAHADLCPYPGLGSGGGGLFGQGGFCDYPTEINGSHMHCEAGGFGVNGISGPLTAAVASDSVAQVSALLVVRGAVQTARYHRHQPARLVEGIHGGDELYEFLQRPYETQRILERTGFSHRGSPAR